MSYLIASDLKRLIQADNLSQIIGGDTSIQTAAQNTAQEIAITHLIQKYDVATEFTDTNIWDPTVIYKTANRVYLDAPAYNVALTYAVGKIVLQAGVIYSCSIAITVAEAFNPGHWTSLGNQYDIFYAQYPNPVFQIANLYPAGTIVFWKDKNYTARVATPMLDHDSILQYGSTDNIPYTNYFPDDTINGPQQWGAGAAYSVAAGTLPTNTTFWTKGDNRSQAMVMYIIDMALYYLHKRIAPRSIPDIRVKAHDDAISALKKYSLGQTTANLTRIQPPTGKRIRSGSNIKQQNNY